MSQEDRAAELEDENNRLRAALDEACSLLSMDDAVRIAIQLESGGSFPTNGDKNCQRCGRANPIWSAPDAEWNRVMGGPAATDDPGGVVCPSCFIDIATIEVGARRWVLMSSE